VEPNAINTADDKDNNAEWNACRISTWIKQKAIAMRT